MGNTSGYHIVPAADEPYHDSPEAPLLRSGSPISRSDPSKLSSITLHLGLLFRLLSSILALTSFLLLVTDGHGAFIASDILLMIIIIFNISVVIHNAVSHIFRITIEVRQRPWNRDLQPKLKVRWVVFFDVGLSAVALICLLVGHLSTLNHRWGSWEAGAIVGYVAVGIQMLSVPVFDGMKFTVAAKLERERSVKLLPSFHGPDAPEDVDAAMMGARPADAQDDVDPDAERISGENLV